MVAVAREADSMVRRLARWLFALDQLARPARRADVAGRRLRHAD
jgi:hypothetical protein